MGKLSEKFGMPPFSVFDARQGVWQDRKRWWISLGIQSELGRGENAISIYDQEWCAVHAPGKVIHKNGVLGNSEQARSHYRGNSVATAINGHGLCDTLAPRQKKSPIKMKGNPASTDHGLLIEDIDIHQSKEHSRDFARCFGQDLMKGENENFGKRLTWVSGERPFDQLDDVSKKILMSGDQAQSGTSIFDPVLSELIYKWFVPVNGTILDPFAGGSVRGIVANYLGYHYTGIDLRPEQISANNVQADVILQGRENPNWIVGDSKHLNELTDDTLYDAIFSCPPYYNLELYSDDKNDISNCDSYESFIDDYNYIIQQSVNKLKDNRFACFVVGDIRDKSGYYRGFVWDTINAFQSCGMKLYNDAVLITAVGSLPIRVGRQFEKYRKLGKTHQNVLIFYKGDTKKIPENFSIPESIQTHEEDILSFV